MSNKSKIFLLSSILILSISSSVWAGEFTVFGPRDYIREEGVSTVITRGFCVLNANTDFYLRVYNYGLEDTATELVSSSSVTINGGQVLWPDNFNQNVSFLELPIVLMSNNLIKVEVRGKAGGAVDPGNCRKRC
ncbi:MAG: hypothetical protein ABH952_09990 [Candidatus Omnitrophota bacterium]